MNESAFDPGVERRCRRLLVRASDEEKEEENDEDGEGKVVEDGGMTVVFSPLLFGFPSSSSSSSPHPTPSSSSPSLPSPPLSIWVIPEMERTNADTPSCGVGCLSSSSGVMNVTPFDFWPPPPQPSPDSLSSSEARPPSSLAVSLEEE